MLLMKWWRSLRTRIIAWSFVPTTIIMLAVALVTFYAYQNVARDLVVGRNEELIRLSAGQLAGDISQYPSLLTTLVRTADIHSDAPEKQRAALAQASNRLVVFDAGVVILSSTGKVVAAEPARPEILGQDWSNRPYFRELIRTTQPVFSNVLPDGPQKTGVVAVAVPITGDQSEFLGSMVGMFRLGATTVSAFYGGIVKLRIGESDTTYLVDTAGNVLYHTDPERVGENLATQAVVQQVVAGKVGNQRTHDLSGRDIIASYAPVPGTPWGLVTEESWAALMEPSQGYRTFLLVLLALGVVVPAVVVTFGVRRITGPIAKLIAASKEVAGGNFGRTISVQTGDELEELATQFNIMSAELQESYAQLEQRVADRTRELAVLNSIAGIVSRSLNLDEIMRDAVDKTMEIMDMEVGGAHRLEDDGKTMTLVYHRGFSEDVVRLITHLPVQSSVAYSAAAAGQPTVMPADQYPNLEVRKLLQRDGMQLVMSIPLMSKGRLLGAINLATHRQCTLGSEAMALLSAIGQQVGVACENARLYARAEQSAATAERNRLARDLHDAVSQTLFSASLIAEVLPRLWERNPEDGQRRLAELRQLTRGALAEMRTLLLELRPTALIEAPLGDLLRQLGEATSGRSRVPVDVRVEAQRPLPPDVQIAFYRIAQESLNNVAKHAGAKHAYVTLQCNAGCVELHIRDDGRGFDMSGVSSDHLGLGIMRERADSVNASLEVTSVPGSGTEIVLLWKEQPLAT